MANQMAFASCMVTKMLHLSITGWHAAAAMLAIQRVMV